MKLLTITDLHGEIYDHTCPYQDDSAWDHAHQAEHEEYDDSFGCHFFPPFLL